jgi:hypothetical protein
MSHDEFDEKLPGAFHALKSERGPCPESDTLVQYANGELAPDRSAAVESHLSLCGICLTLITRLRQDAPVLADKEWKQTEKRLDQRTAPWRPETRARPSAWTRFRMPLAAAAAVVLSVALWVSIRQPSTGPVSTTRGDFIQLTEPAGPVARLDFFRWNDLPAAASFRLQIRRGEQNVWEAVATGSLYFPPDELQRLLAPGARYEWRLQALNTSGRLLGESSWLEFHILP